MGKFIIILIGVLFISSCYWDNYGLDLLLPTDFTLVNKSQTTVSISQLYSSPEAESLFGFTRISSMDPDDTVTLRVSYETLDDIRAGKFTMVGVCGDITNWKKVGDSLGDDVIITVTEYPSGAWSASILIKKCTP